MAAGVMNHAGEYWLQSCNRKRSQHKQTNKKNDNNENQRQEGEREGSLRIDKSC